MPFRIVGAGVGRTGTESLKLALAIDRSKMPGGGDPAFIDGMFSRFTFELGNPQATMEAYEVHNRKVRESVEPERLVEWKPGDGWAPLCEALGVPEPEEPFPHLNTTEMFRQRLAEFGAAGNRVDR
jgi:hypothetical protein